MTETIPIPEIWNELRKYERKQYTERLIGRGIEKLRPTDAAAARQALYAIIDRATAHIALKAQAHRVRAEINDSLAADRLAFDDSPEAEPCVASTWLAAGAWHARSTHCLSSAAPLNWSIVCRPIWLARYPQPVTRSNARNAK